MQNTLEHVMHLGFEHQAFTYSVWKESINSGQLPGFSAKDLFGKSAIVCHSRTPGESMETIVKKYQEMIAPLQDLQ